MTFLPVPFAASLYVFSIFFAVRGLSFSISGELLLEGFFVSGSREDFLEMEPDLERWGEEMESDASSTSLSESPSV